MTTENQVPAWQLEEALTPAQIENWRHAMFPILGPYVLICPPERIQQLRDNMQRTLDNEAQP